jgi:hypothetical protein
MRGSLPAAWAQEWVRHRPQRHYLIPHTPTHAPLSPYARRSLAATALTCPPPSCQGMQAETADGRPKATQLIGMLFAGVEDDEHRGPEMTEAKSRIEKRAWLDLVASKLQVGWRDSRLTCGWGRHRAGTHRWRYTLYTARTALRRVSNITRLVQRGEDSVLTAWKIGGVGFACMEPVRRPCGVR